MVHIASRGCITTCSHCRSVLEFLPSETHVILQGAEGGVSAARENDVYDVGVVCPRCSHVVVVTSLLEADDKAEVLERYKKGVG